MTLLGLSRLTIEDIKVKVSLEQATKAQRERRCIALMYLKPRARWGGWSTSEQNVKHFVAALKRFLYHHSFYSISEYLEYKKSKLYLQM
jgi:hypothetical protein